jgi:hypothetical protein
MGQGEQESSTLETSGKDGKTHSKRAGKMCKYTPNSMKSHLKFCRNIKLEDFELGSPSDGPSMVVDLVKFETYGRIGLLRSYSNLQSYWTTTKLFKLTVVLHYYEAMETYSRIALLRSYGNLQSYWTTTKPWKLTVVLQYYLFLVGFLF